jgi:hypothetical protein
MKSNNYLTLICALSISTLVYSQKLEKLGEVTFRDFSTTNFQSPTILIKRTLVTFPYLEQGGKTGARDEDFTVRIESIYRIVINKSDSVNKNFCLSKKFDSGIQIKNVKYYYKNGNSIAMRKIKISDLDTLQNDKGVYIDYSKVLKDSSAILEISYRSDSKSKQTLQFFLDNSFNYKDFNIQIYIPEIYVYNVLKLNQCISLETKKDLLGPIIGYYAESGPQDKLVPKFMVDQFVKMYGSSVKYNAVNCRNNLFSFRFNGNCSKTNPLDEIINLKLLNINEIK